MISKDVMYQVSTDVDWQHIIASQTTKSVLDLEFNGLILYALHSF
jgi:hypothetical protein